MMEPGSCSSTAVAKASSGPARLSTVLVALAAARCASVGKRQQQDEKRRMRVTVLIGEGHWLKDEPKVSRPVHRRKNIIPTPPNRVLPPR